jgi:uncharacterized protein YqgV (UPF0045/DUF77 family)
VELRAEFTVEPFVAGQPGPHVRAAIETARELGLDPDVGPFATTIAGDAQTVLNGLVAITTAAVGTGASRVTIHVSSPPTQPEHAFLQAIAPVAKALNAELLAPGELVPGDIPLSFEGEALGGLRLPRASAALDRMIAEVERELGDRLAGLSREDKQRAVKLLDERGAFELRRSTDDVADALGVSRITVYNYLNKS